MVTKQLIIELIEHLLSFRWLCLETEMYGITKGDKTASSESVWMGRWKRNVY